MQHFAGRLPVPLASSNVEYPTLLFSIIRAAFLHPALWNTLLFFEAINGALSGGTVSESEFDGEVDEIVISTGVALSAVLIADSGQAIASTVAPLPSLGTKSTAMAQ